MDISALSWSFLLDNWNKTNVYEMITHYTSCQQCRTVSNSVNSVNNVNSVNSYSAVLPPSPMVFLLFCFVALFVYLVLQNICLHSFFADLGEGKFESVYAHWLGSFSPETWVQSSLYFLKRDFQTIKIVFMNLTLFTICIHITSPPGQLPHVS